VPFETPDSAVRAQLSELMDEPCSYAEFRAFLRDLMYVNWTVFSYRPILNWLGQFAGGSDQPLHIVDVGCGGGDMLRRIESWAQQGKIAVRLTDIDLNPFAAQAAREFGDAKSSIEWVNCEAYGYKPQAKIDLVISSLFTHHLLDAEIIGFLRWMERVTALWLVCERSSPRSHSLLRFQTPGARNALAPLCAARWAGVGSTQFRARRWRRYTREAGLPAHAANIFTTWPGRLCVARVK
jgi:SAM-dependent methyltransferase